MNVLVVGGGGREHALAWKCAQSDRVHRVFVAPGNAGTATESKCENVAIDADDSEALVAFALAQNIDLTVIGPEAPLVDGIVDVFQANHLRCFGPLRNAAQLEGSKAYTKAFLDRYKIPTAQFETFTDADEAKRYIEARGTPIVVKADGLAAGKGVVVAQNIEEAAQAVDDMLVQGAFGEAGNQIVIEDCLEGEEASFIAIIDGTTVVPLATSQDHKARDNGDVGPNTGGMGAYSPAPVIDEQMYQKVMREVMMPTVRGLIEDGCRYTGFLYAGLMISDDGALNVLEFNCRLGDPETQPIMMRLRSDITQLFDAAIDRDLQAATSTEWDDRPCVGVVMAAGGYPGKYQQGLSIQGLDRDLPDTKVFHAGTRADAGQVLSAGGRVLCVCALGDDVRSAQHLAYQRVGSIKWHEAFYRTDIAYRAVAREEAAV